MPGPNFLAAAFAQETDAVFLALIEISHPDLIEIEDPLLIDDVVRLVANTEDVTSNGNVYTAFGFTISLPSSRPDEPPTTRLRIDGVDRRIIDVLRIISGAPTIKLSVVLASDPDAVELGPLELDMVEVQIDALAIEGELTYEDVLNEPFPGDSFTPANFPGLFA